MFQDYKFYFERVYHDCICFRTTRFTLRGLIMIVYVSGLPGLLWERAYHDGICFRTTWFTLRGLIMMNCVWGLQGSVWEGLSWWYMFQDYKVVWENLEWWYMFQDYKVQFERTYHDGICFRTTRFSLRECWRRLRQREIIWHRTSNTGPTAGWPLCSVSGTSTDPDLDPTSPWNFLPPSLSFSSLYILRRKQCMQGQGTHP